MPAKRLTGKPKICCGTCLVEIQSRGDVMILFLSDVGKSRCAFCRSRMATASGFGVLMYDKDLLGEILTLIRSKCRTQ